jgi:hypothetical protein
LSAPEFEITDQDDIAQDECVCRRVRGFADCAAVDALITVPSHWPPVVTEA